MLKEISFFLMDGSLFLHKDVGNLVLQAKAAKVLKTPYIMSGGVADGLQEKETVHLCIFVLFCLFVECIFVYIVLFVCLLNVYLCIFVLFVCLLNN